MLASNVARFAEGDVDGDGSRGDGAPRAPAFAGLCARSRRALPRRALAGEDNARQGGGRDSLASTLHRQGRTLVARDARIARMRTRRLLSFR